MYKKWDNLSNEDLINILKELNSKVKYISQDVYSKYARKNHLPSYKVFFNRFNIKKWTDVLKLANILNTNIWREKQSHIYYSREYGIEKVIEYYKLVGSRIPTNDEFNKNKWRPSYLWYKKEFGGVYEACKQANICTEKDHEDYRLRLLGKNNKKYKETHIVEKINQSEIKINETINEIIRLSNILGRCPTHDEYDKFKNGGYSSSHINKVFDMSYRQLCDKYIISDKSSKRFLSSKLSHEEIKNKLKSELVDFYNSYGFAPKQSEFKKYGLFSIGQYIKYFNMSYNDILKSLNLNINKCSFIDKSNEDLLKEFYNVFIKLGHVPVGREYKTNGLVQRYIYTSRFGSIEKVCKELQIDFEKYYNPASAGITCLDNNGMSCKSIIEKDITNFFILNNLNFVKEFKYNNLIANDKRRFDWKVSINDKNYYIEYAGMYRENSNRSVEGRYSKKIKNKINDLTNNGYISKCIFIYPNDIKNKSLKEIFDKEFNLDLINLSYSKYEDTVKYKDLTNEELLNLFLLFYKNNKNSYSTKNLISYNCSLYFEIKKRYKTYYNFLKDNNINEIQKPRNYWNYDVLIDTFNYMVNKYNCIFNSVKCRKQGKADNKLKGFYEASVSIVGSYNKMKLKYLKYCNDNNIILSEDIVNQIYFRNKEAI